MTARIVPLALLAISLGCFVDGGESGEAAGTTEATTSTTSESSASSTTSGTSSSSTSSTSSTSDSSEVTSDTNPTSVGSSTGEPLGFCASQDLPPDACADFDGPLVGWNAGAEQHVAVTIDGAEATSVPNSVAFELDKAAPTPNPLSALYSFSKPANAVFGASIELQAMFTSQCDWDARPFVRIIEGTYVDDAGSHQIVLRIGPDRAEGWSLEGMSGTKVLDATMLGAGTDTWVPIVFQVRPTDGTAALTVDGQLLPPIALGWNLGGSATSFGFNFGPWENENFVTGPCTYRVDDAVAFVN